MNIIVNDILPPPNCVAINLFEQVFVRRDLWSWRSEKDKAETLNHEGIHTLQMRELLWIFFYVIYGLEWFVRLFINGPKDAYKNISFEKEAFAHQGDPFYTKHRRHYAQWRN